MNPQSLPVLSQYKTCPQHHALVLSLSSVLQTIAICCPGALIWNSIPCGASSSSITSSASNSTVANTDMAANKPAVLGSPLDRLSIPPSSMPLPSPGNTQASLNSEVGTKQNEWLLSAVHVFLCNQNWNTFFRQHVLFSCYLCCLQVRKKSRQEVRQLNLTGLQINTKTNLQVRKQSTECFWTFKYCYNKHTFLHA